MGFDRDMGIFHGIYNQQCDIWIWYIYIYILYIWIYIYGYIYIWIYMGLKVVFFSKWQFGGNSIGEMKINHRTWGYDIVIFQTNSIWLNYKLDQWRNNGTTSPLCGRCHCNSYTCDSFDQVNFSLITWHLVGTRWVEHGIVPIITSYNLLVWLGFPAWPVGKRAVATALFRELILLGDLGFDKQKLP